MPSFIIRTISNSMLTIIVSLFLVAIIYLGAKEAQKKNLIAKYLNQDITPAEFACKFDPAKIKEGLNYFKDKRLIIAGLVRDSIGNLETMKANVAKLGAAFTDWCLLIVENDSKDGTRKALLEWAKTEPRITVLGCGENADTCELNLPKTIFHTHGASRIRKMVLLRNIYMDYIEAHPERFQNYDFLVALDLDLFGTFYLDGLGAAGHHFYSEPSIQALCANGIYLWNLAFMVYRKYHDTYAHKELQGEYPLVKVGPFWTVPTCSDKPWRVNSCFNGLTIYRLSSVLGKQYILKEEAGEALCEHVTFNQQLDSMYIAPYFIFVIIEN